MELPFDVVVDKEVGADLRCSGLRPKILVRRWYSKSPLSSKLLVIFGVSNAATESSLLRIKPWENRYRSVGASSQPASNVIAGNKNVTGNNLVISVVLEMLSAHILTHRIHEL